MINKEEWKNLVQNRLQNLYEKSGKEGVIAPVTIQVPPKPEMGDLGSPMFPFAKSFRMAPPQIAAAVAEIIVKAAEESKTFDGINPSEIGTFSAVGPYVNVKLNKANAAGDVLALIEEQGESYGSLDKNGKKPFEGRRVMVEYSSPNTKKN